jgi:uncharacterized protein
MKFPSFSSKRFAHFIFNYRWYIVATNLIILFSVGVAMTMRVKRYREHINYMEAIRKDPTKAKQNYQGQRPIFDSDYRIWLDKKDENLRAMEEHQEIYTREDLLVVLVSARNGGDLWTNKNLQSLKILTEKLWQVDYSTRIDGLANFSLPRATGDEIVVQEFLRDLPFTARDLERKKDLVLNDPILTKLFISPDLVSSQITVRIIAPRDFPNAFADAKKTAVKIVEEMKILNPDLEILLGGSVMLNNAYVEFALHDQKTLIPLMFLFMILTMLLMYRSVAAMLLSLGTLLTAILFPTLFFVGALGYSLNSASANTILLMVAIAIADSIHIISSYLKLVRKGHAKREAIEKMLERNFLPCLLTSLTTAIGLFSLVAQDIPPFRDLGLFAGTGTIYAWLTSVFTLPALLYILPIGFFRLKRSAAIKPGNAKITYLAFVDFIVKRSRAILLLGIGTTIVASVFVWRININNDTMAYFNKNSEFRVASEKIEEVLVGTMPFEFNFKAPGPGGIYEPLFLHKLERFQKYLMSEPKFGFTFVSSYLDVVKRMNQAVNGGAAAQYKIPEQTGTQDTRKLIAQYMFLYNSNLAFGSDLKNFISSDESMIRVVAYAKTQTSNERVVNAMAINGWLKNEMPEMSARAIGIPVMFGMLLKHAIPGLLWALVLSLSLITLSMMIGFRSIKLGLLSMIPNVWPIAIVYGVLGISQYTVDLGVSIVGMITLGIAVDDTIHFLGKYQQFAREGLSSRQAILKTFEESGNALIMTSVILVVGFGLLSFSDFLINVNLGLFSASIISLALFADFIITPALIVALNPGNKGQEAKIK